MMLTMNETWFEMFLFWMSTEVELQRLVCTWITREEQFEASKNESSKLETMPALLNYRLKTLILQFKDINTTI